MARIAVGPRDDITLEARIETWPIAGDFTISRGTKREAIVVVAEITLGASTGRGECVPYPRYGEAPDTTLAAILGVGRSFIDQARSSGTLSTADLQSAIPASAARNAIDCAIWDLAAKSAGRRAWDVAGLPPPSPCPTCYTLSLAEPTEMAARAAEVSQLPLLKLKLGESARPQRDAERMKAVRAARPDARLVADANEGWTEDTLAWLLAAAADHGMEMVEQPLPADADGLLARVPHPVAVCADESVHTADALPALKGRYDAVNIKLDKAGGLTHALVMAAEAERLGLDIVLGCMVATSLSMSPSMLLASRARWVDLDGPLLLSRDRTPGLVIRDGMIEPPTPEVWG
jgi:L-alanine-DL-glutamate epimerase-like enolase superfamily enzyme